MSLTFLLQKGGVVYADSGAIVEIRTSIFQNNAAEEVNICCCSSFNLFPNFYE
jgi:hypothetical protein